MSGSGSRPQIASMHLAVQKAKNKKGHCKTVTFSVGGPAGLLISAQGTD